MSKQNKLLILIGIVVMFGLFKNIMGGGASDEQVLEAIKNGATLVDVRSPQEFAAGSVSKAINLPVDRIAALSSKIDNKKPVVVFCRSGNRSAQAKQILEQQGFKNVINGGTWQQVKAVKSQL